MCCCISRPGSRAHRVAHKEQISTWCCIRFRSFWRWRPPWLTAVDHGSNLNLHHQHRGGSTGSGADVGPAARPALARRQGEHEAPVGLDDSWRAREPAVGEPACQCQGWQQRRPGWELGTAPRAIHTPRPSALDSARRISRPWRRLSASRTPGAHHRGRRRRDRTRSRRTALCAPSAGVNPEGFLAAASARSRVRHGVAPVGPPWLAEREPPDGNGLLELESSVVMALAATTLGVCTLPRLCSSDGISSAPFISQHCAACISKVRSREMRKGRASRPRVICATKAASRTVTPNRKAALASC
ncbi:hypothetical protein K491DRAFT_758196 [Lophiostoma macrostomum CBS 122681]|uniref:Uncharacterized protein n=1 Tax=Lophiostoma macrostomum CBS 122681 TaxID=1314788 RepID=A0A6A6T6W6_9PLEO|nr:hypothetical protein K491DRAFT_758196 [Lophiostoma macrostomum CBS 122681]